MEMCVDGTKSVQTKMTYHVSFGSSYRLDGTGTHIFNIYRLNDAPEDLVVMEGSRYVKGLDATMP